MAAAYASSDDEDQQLIKNLALFLCNFLHSHLRLIETPDNTELLINAPLYLIKICCVDDLGNGLNGTQGLALNGIPLRKNIYGDILSNLRLVMIEKMVKPEEASHAVIKSNTS